MKKLIPFLLVLLFWCCSENVPEAAPTVKNDNANPVYPPHAGRLEIPRLKGGLSLFLAKEVPNFGVNYCAEFDCALRSTRWVAFRWDIDNIADCNVGRTNAWDEDEDIPAEYRVRLSDHTSDGYDRGHMLASEDRQNSVRANEQTFLMTNMFPQYNRFNGYSSGKSYVWVNMEEKARSFYKGWTRNNNAQDTIYVVRGGTIDSDSQILEETVKGLIVPRFFYMAFLYKNNQSSQFGYKAMAFWVEHTDGVDTTRGNALKKYVISIDDLERRTGIDFFCNLPDHIEQVVEANVVPSAWGFD